MAFCLSFSAALEAVLVDHPECDTSFPAFLSTTVDWGSSFIGADNSGLKTFGARKPLPQVACHRG